MIVPTCTNCGGPLATAMYCEPCLRRDGETWFEWRERLARTRLALRSVERSKS